MKTQTTAQTVVRADGEGLVSHAGAYLLVELADRLELTAALSEAMAPSRERRSAHDPGMVLRDLAVAIRRRRRSRAWSEYETYAPEVARILHETNDPEEAAAGVAEYLGGVERHSMGIDSDKGRLDNARLAASLVAWHEWSYARGGSPHHDDD